MTDAKLLIAEILGYIAGALLVISFCPQIYRIWRLKRAKDISYAFTVLQATLSALYVVYGALIDELPLLIMNAIAIGQLVLIIIMKYFYDKWEDEEGINIDI